MKLIAAADKNWAIGKNNSLLISIPADMKFFRETTSGHVIVMGRKTLESFPNGAPLKNRVNIVLTRDKDYKKDGAVIVHDINELVCKLKEYNQDDVFVIGGGSVYKLLLPMCDTAYITKIDMAFDADTYIPDLDKSDEWKVEHESEQFEHEKIGYKFVTYKRKQI